MPVAIALRARRTAPVPDAKVRLRAGWERPAGFLCAAAVGGAGLVQLAAGAATSADLAYFWGVKAVLFARDGGMDFELMQLPRLMHLHPTYPPLWPASLAWGSLVSQSMPWSAVPVLTWVWLAAAALVVHSLLRASIGGRAAVVVSCLWFSVLTLSMLRSFSGGSAEGPLVFFVSVAVTALAVETRDARPRFRALAAAALACAVLTKSEGAVAAVLVVGGTVLRDRVWRRPRGLRAAAALAAPAVAAWLLWTVVRIVRGLPLTDPTREPPLAVGFDHLDVIFKVCVRLLAEDGLWIGWLVPLLAAATVRPLRPVRVLPGLAVAAGLPMFSVFYYLHAVGNPLELVVWTFPRLLQPALSAWIVCLGLLCFVRRDADPG
jgi:hypothetical protein